MKRATSICTTIIVALLLLASAKGTAQPASTNQLSSMVTLTRIPPVQMVNSILISPDGKRIATLQGEGTSWNSGGKPLNLQMWQVSAPQSKPTSQLHRQPESPGRLLRLTGVSSDGPDASGMVTSVSRAAMRVNLSGFPSDNFGGLTRSTFTV